MKELSAFLFLAIAWQMADAQVGISNTTVIPHSSAMLQVDAGSDPLQPKGFLIPRFSSGQEAALTAPADGLLYYSTSTKKFVFRHTSGSTRYVLNPWRTNNDSSRLTFVGHASSNVGIGTHAPDEKLHVVGKVKATEFVGNGTIPLGGIIMWSGTSIPTGWALCNGQTSNGYQTPNLSGRFVVGYSSSDTDYDQPGNLSQQLLVTGEVGPPTSLDYDLVDNGKKITLKIASMPSHDHGGTTTGTGAHGHTIDGKDNSGWAFPIARRSDDSGGGGNIPTNPGGNHSHTIADEGGGVSHENRPPYYVLAFIMRTQ